MPERTAGFREVFAVGEFRVLWLAQVQSRIGDQFARVALSLLVFDVTDSAGLTALVYALTFLPPLLTASLLTGLADRYSRRTVMVAVEILRALLIAVMALPSLPLPLAVALVVAATGAQPLFAAARTATLPKVLPDERYPVGVSIMSSTDGLAQIVGFGLGGVVVGASGSPHLALAINAGTFALSAVLLRWGIRPHVPQPDPAESGSRPGRFALAGVRLIARDRRMLGLVALIWLFGCFVVPQALAAPYADQLGAGDMAVGVLMAADPVGMTIGALLATRVGPTARRRLTVPLAVAAGLPLVATLTAPGLPITFALWTISGALGTYMVFAQITFTRIVPDGVRARAIGVASAGLQSAQGLGVLAGGALAELMPPSAAIAVCAAAGSLAALVIGAVFRVGAIEAVDPDPPPEPEHGGPEPSRGGPRTDSVTQTPARPGKENTIDEHRRRGR